MMEEKELGIIPRLRWVYTGFSKCIFRCEGRSICPGLGKVGTYLHHWHDGKFCGIYSP